MSGTQIAATILTAMVCGIISPRGGFVYLGLCAIIYLIWDITPFQKVFAP